MVSGKRKSNKKESITVRAVSYILSCEDEQIKNLTTEGVAAVIDQHDINFLLAVFKQEQKISLPDFIKREKIHRATFLLEKTNTSIKELSAKFGFISIRDFKNEFENYFFVTPGKYRKFKKNKTGLPVLFLIFY